MREDSNGYIDLRIAVPETHQEIFSHFYFAENRSAETITRILLPSFQTILIFSFGKIPLLHSREETLLEVQKCIMLGPVKHAFKYSLPPKAEILTINFKDDAFYRFFGSTAMAEHLPVHPDELLSDGCFAILWHELKKLNNTNDRVNHILQFCEPYLRYRDKIAEQLAKFNAQAVDPIKYVAGENSQTERNIQIAYKKNFGYSAKEFGRYRRFLKAIELIQVLSVGSSKVDWFEVISECGYYDQSQLIHDFNHYINITPAKYLKFQQDICNPIS